MTLRPFDTILKGDVHQMKSDMKAILIALAALLAITTNPVRAGILDWLFGPDNYWECILDRMPGTLTYGGSMEVITRCTQEFPDKTAYQLPRRSIFKPKDFGQCLKKYWKSEREPLAQQSIYQACYFLYPP